MQHHIYLLSSLIISFYILTEFLLCYMFSKGHVTLTSLLFSDTSQCMLFEPLKFLPKKNWIFISRQETISEMKLLDLLSIPGWLQLSRSVDMSQKIIEFYWFMHSVLCAVESASKSFITRSLEDGFVRSVLFSKWRQIWSIPKCKY